MNSSKGRQTERYYSPGFIDNEDNYLMKMSIENELRSISVALVKLKAEIDKLNKQLNP